MSAERLRQALTAAARGAALTLLSAAGSPLLLALIALSLSLIPLGVGLYTTPAVLGLLRAHADRRRHLAQRWSGVTVPDDGRPFPRRTRPGFTGHAAHTFRLLQDPATWRDARWLLPDATLGSLLALLPPGLLAQGVLGVVLAAGGWRPVVEADGTHWYTFLPVSSQTTATLAGLLGLVLITLGLRFGPALVRRHFLLTRALLLPTGKQALTRRVERLQETRYDAVDSSAAELRRIERDLHDGAQARLVAMGMNLGAVEALIGNDPEQARKLLAQARENSAEALNELRDLVSGIHPPVLAERGLGDAARALALRMPLPVETDIDLPGRLPEPVESAAYFSVSELLTNAVKHSAAERVLLSIGHRPEDRALRISVRDDGRGGADATGGSGLLGIERRLGAFDGVLTVSSPAGGPTVVTIELPCTPLTSRAGAPAPAPGDSHGPARA
ncbi:histidine kinase [Streptomyces sp. ACA25]|nr:sensor histidine kinase [Streptomyces sp. ACA25]MDB1089992.1 histidine kinase [Streptomyces sp. ACA25]